MICLRCRSLLWALFMRTAGTIRASGIRCGTTCWMSLSTSFHKYTDVLFWWQTIPFRCDSGGRCCTMPRTSPFPIHLSAGEAAELRRRATKYTSPYFQVQRAKIILMAAEGLENSEIAERLNTRRDVVSEWRKRFFEERLAGLEERSRPGRPRTFSP